MKFYQMDTIVFGVMTYESGDVLTTNKTGAVDVSGTYGISWSIDWMGGLSRTPVSLGLLGAAAKEISFQVAQALAPTLIQALTDINIITSQPE